uniref:Uncharacterized protein n=1 Tax=Parascaris univalens TaxID=6257 RepID=A0A915CLC3_PARUN
MRSDVGVYGLVRVMAGASRGEMCGPILACMGWFGRDGRVLRGVDGLGCSASCGQV